MEWHNLLTQFEAFVKVDWINITLTCYYTVLYLVSTANPAVDPFIHMTAIERFYGITIPLNVHTINMKVFSLINCAEKILHCKAD
jgi:hypothetical protein